MKFEVNLKTEMVDRGGIVRGTAVAGDAAKSRSVTARLCFKETIAGTDLEFGVAELDPVAIHDGALARGQEVWFDLPVPEGAFPTYSGREAKLTWYVLVIADEAGLDSRGEAEFVVAPEARSSKREGDLGTGLAVS